jgi:hypothetical protein
MLLVNAANTGVVMTSRSTSREAVNNLIPTGRDIINLLKHIGFHITPSYEAELIPVREEWIKRELAAIFPDYGGPELLERVRHWIRERTR